MPLPKMVLTVWVDQGDDEPAEHEVNVRHVDRLTAEVQMKSLGVDAATMPMHLMTAWAWAALKREGVYTKPLAPFLKGDCAGIETDDESEETVPPTTEGQLDGSS